jgi:lipopolysaccharide transport system ATP-binding protein
MTEIAVRAHDVGKRYRIGSSRPGQLTLQETLADAFPRPLRSRGPVPRIRETSSPSSDHIWALRNVSFEVPRGQILGIIGPNGAGKSTLLKILSRITLPTTGRVELYGRVGSLLEIGTGFHPELTGRENIYLNGALLGMRNWEIGRKLDEIIAFSEIERFIDTPVKRYSSGMYVRLAFAVAAHLEPDILIVDEALAVGDVAFQRKCLSKMENVSQHGRTILFVSHNTQAIARLCHRALLVSQGVVRKDGPASEVTSAYLRASLSLKGEREWVDEATAPGNDIARLRRVRVRTENGATVETADIRQPLGIEIVYEVLKPEYTLIPYFDLYDDSGVCAFTVQDLDPQWRRHPRPVGVFTSVAWIPSNLLSEGAFLVHPGLYTVKPFIVHFKERDAVAFQVIDRGEGDSARGDWDGVWGGVVRPILTWTTEF